MQERKITLGRRFASSPLSALSIMVESDDPPREFRLFAAGENATEKGSFLFDDEAAKAVRSAADAWGVDTMIDLEHLSLDEESPAFDPDARGWCRLEVRPGPELWAVDVRWTDDGEVRLRSKRQRYISPAFLTDEDGRVCKIINIALTAIPATHGTPALVAAAQRTKGMNEEQIKLCFRVAQLRREGVADAEVVERLAIDIKSLQAVVKAMGGDPSADLGQLMSTVATYAKELSEMAQGKQAESTDESEAPMPEASAVEEEEKDKTMAVSARDEVKRLRAELEAQRAKDLAELETLKAEKQERDLAERQSLVAELVVLGYETPASAWVASDGKTPKGMLATMPLVELRQRVKDFGGKRKVESAPKPISSSPITSPGRYDLSEYETKRLRIACEKNKRDYDEALQSYREYRLQALNGAKSPRDMQRLGRGIEQEHVVASVTGRIGTDEIHTLANAVKPIETFGAASQRFLEEFRLEMMVNMAALPPDWTSEIGEVLPGGSLKDTYPLDFSAVKYRERLAQNAGAETPQSSEISVSKREFRAAKQADLTRLVRGDFAYIKTWQQGAGQMARARVSLKADLVTTLLEANGTWEDGLNFFSASHKVHPFDPTQETKAGSTTWSNYDSGATPLNASNLTSKKQASLIVPGFDGLLMGTMADGILYPASLASTADELLLLQDFIASSNAALRNVHFKSGMRQIMGQELAGSDTTANWYLINFNTIAMGFVPWVVAEDNSEEVLTWDEASDFYKQTGFIKTESKIYTNAALIWPHAVMLVTGA